MLFNLAISCLTMSNLPWFIPRSFVQFFFTALDFTFTTRQIHNWKSFPLWPSCYILSGAICNCPPLFSRTYYIPCSDLRGLIFQYHRSFCLFILFMRFSRQEYWSGLPFSPPVDHILSEFFTRTHLFWVVLHSMAHSLTELQKPLRQGKAVIHEGLQE